MSPLWALPLVVLAGGVAAVAAAARHAVSAAAELRVDVVELRRLTREIGVVRTDAQALLAHVHDPRRGTGTGYRARATASPRGAPGRALGARIDR